MLVWLTFFALDAGHRFGAVGILAIVAANTVFLGGLAVFLTRARRVPIEIAALACAAIFSVWNDNHDVQLVDLPDRRAAHPDHERGVFVVGGARAGRARQADPGDRRRRGRRRHSRRLLDVARAASPRRHSRRRRACFHGGCLRSAACRAAASAPRSTRDCAAIPPAQPPRPQIASEILAGAVPRADGRQVGVRRSPAMVPAGADPQLRSIERDGDGICRGLQRARASRLDGREVHRVSSDRCRGCAGAAAEQHQRAAGPPHRRQPVSRGRCRTSASKSRTRSTFTSSPAATSASRPRSTTRRAFRTSAPPAACARRTARTSGTWSTAATSRTPAPTR